MHVVAFAVSNKAVLDATGGVKAEGFPMTSAHVDELPKLVTVPVVLAAYAEKGTDYDPTRYIVAKSPKGEQLSVTEVTWNWPDIPGSPVKYRVLLRFIALQLDAAGLYTIGLYDTPDATETNHLFPLLVSKVNPLLGR